MDATCGIRGALTGRLPYPLKKSTSHFTDLTSRGSALQTQPVLANLFCLAEAEAQARSELETVAVSNEGNPSHSGCIIQTRNTPASPVESGTESLN
jgi:hypothetical protein